MRRSSASLACGVGAIVVSCAASSRPSAMPSAGAPVSDAGSVTAEEAGTGPRDGGATGIEALRSIYLGGVTVVRGGEGKVGGRAGARLTIVGELGGGAEEIKRRGLRSVRMADGLDVTVQAYPVRSDAPRARDRSPSFVIDFDTDEVREVRAQAAHEHGERPAMRDLTRFVARYIETKDLARGYDPASVVARRREGDCTEHAVLLAALGRSFGYAARVVHGAVFVEEKGQLLGGMHAWVEWHDGRAWSCADAAIGDEHDPLYLPFQTLDDESPAFGRHLLLTVAQDIRRVTLAPLSH